MSDAPVGLEIFEDVKRIIVVAAHPDDLECLCGGTVSLLTAARREVISVKLHPGRHRHPGRGDGAPGPWPAPVSARPTRRHSSPA
ncbi:MAG: hypothetical protein R3A10_07860 [Caldilineaceae bacterium]